jgi:hypothetical protein
MLKGILYERGLKVGRGSDYCKGTILTAGYVL